MGELFFLHVLKNKQTLYNQIPCKSMFEPRSICWEEVFSGVPNIYTHKVFQGFWDVYRDSSWFFTDSTMVNHHEKAAIWEMFF